MRGACAWVVERAREVRIGPLERALAAVRERPVPDWDRRRHLHSGDPRLMAAYVLVLDTANFSFWGRQERQAASPWQRRGGYWLLAEAVRDAFLAGGPLSDPQRLAELSSCDLEALLPGMPMPAERAGALRELGRLALDELEGDLGRLVEPTAAATAAGLAGRLPSFADFAEYDGRRIPLLKRAQIAAADLWGAGAADFPDLEALTCFADYKLPQALRKLGALEYSQKLAGRVDDWRELAPGEPAEVEIRAATVTAVERLREALAAQGRELASFQLDWILWDLSQSLYPVRPHHRVRTPFY